MHNATKGRFRHRQLKEIDIVEVFLLLDAVFISTYWISTIKNNFLIWGYVFLFTFGVHQSLKMELYSEPLFLVF